MGSGQKRVALAVYRSVLKWSRANRDVPFTLRPGDVQGLAPHGSAVAAAKLLQDAAAIPPIARAEFDACRQLAGEEAEEALDRGLGGVRVLHSHYSQLVEAMREVRRDREDKTGVKFAVGQVFIHKKYGFRGVVYGWDRECQRDEDWRRAMNVQNPQQPFYYCLPDETDCVRLFGGVRITKYVAQDNMQIIDSRIVHRALDNYFSGYSSSRSRYIPCSKLQFEYPDLYEAEDAAPVGDDANLLAHEEVEPSPATRLQTGRDTERSFVEAQA